VAFTKLMAPVSEPGIVAVGGNDSRPAGFGGVGSDQYRMPPPGIHRFGHGSRASELASLALDIEGGETEKNREKALQILTDLEIDPRNRLFALNQYLGSNTEPSDAVLAALDSIRQQVDRGWDAALDRRAEPLVLESGKPGTLDSLAREIELATDRLDLRFKLVRTYRKIGQTDPAESLMAGAEPDLSAYNQAVRNYNAEVARLHSPMSESPWDRAALWPAVLSAFGFILTGISHPILQAIGGGVVTRTKTRQEAKS
jgi:hypothetical protein